MGREVRRVPANWHHPRSPDDHHEQRRRGKPVPLYEGGNYANRAAEWDEDFQHWQQGVRRDYETDGWKPIEAEYIGTRYTEYAGARPSPDDYMPEWPDEQRTHYQMYEDTSEGTPISPVMETPEALARWLTDNNASAFGDMTATYEQWLYMARGGWAPSMVISSAGLQSGVAAMSEPPHD